MDECPHMSYGILDPSTCTMCIAGPTLPEAPKKPKKAKKKKPKRIAPVDPEERRLMEFLSGIRCERCKGLRSGPAMHCPHEREDIVRANIEAIDSWQSANPDVKGKLVATAAAGSISRVTLRGGLRNAPSEVEGLSVGGLIGLANRVVQGKAMEWSRSQRSGDELPV